jgi:excisionase family DNA binding protein
MDHLLNEQEAAAYLGCSVGLLRKWRLFRQGPAYVRLGGRLVRYERSALDAYINAAIVR